MTEADYLRYLEAFNARDYAAMETFFADDCALENAGFIVRGKRAFREFYRFFHAYCRETVRFKGFYPGMTPVAKGSRVELEFLILDELNAQGLVQHIKGAVYVPAAAAAAH